MGRGGGTDSVAVGVVDVLGANPKVCRLPLGTAEQDAWPHPRLLLNVRDLKENIVPGIENVHD